MRAVIPKPKRMLARLSVAVRYVKVQSKTAESPTDNAPEAPISRVRLATAAAMHNWNRVFVRPM